MLYLVPTPIGNLGDMSPRAIEILKSVDLILAEDTRNTGKLLQLLHIENRMKAFHAHNEHNQLDYIIQLLHEGQEIAMVTDAGTPGISDPGFLLVRACHENEIKVSCLPGPTAFVPALAASGIPSEKFFFEGFLPQKKGRKTRWDKLSEIEVTIVLYESPYRIVKCLKEINTYKGSEIQICVAREISKLHEEIVKGKAQDVLKEFESRKSIKGEFVIIIGPPKKNKGSQSE